MTSYLYFVWNEFYGGLQNCTLEDVANCGPEINFFRMDVNTNVMEEFNVNGTWSVVTSQYNSGA